MVLVTANLRMMIHAGVNRPPRLFPLALNAGCQGSPRPQGESVIVAYQHQHRRNRERRLVDLVIGDGVRSTLSVDTCDQLHAHQEVVEGDPSTSAQKQRTGSAFPLKHHYLIRVASKLCGLAYLHPHLEPRPRP